MAVYIILTILSVLFSLLVVPEYRIEGSTLTRQKAVNKAALWLVFGMLFSVSACRVAVGNDYNGYRQFVLKIAQNEHVSTEFGFNWLVRIVQFITNNDDCYLIVLGIFSFATVYLFIKAMYEQSDWFAASVFILLTGGYYFLSLNSVRYYFALALAMVAMQHVIKGDYLKFLMMVLVGACFHKSMLVVLVIYPLAKIKWKKWVLWLAAGFCVSLILFKNVYREIIFLFYPYYENSAFDNGDVSVVNILKSAAVILFAIIYYKQSIKDNDKNRFYLNLQIGALIVYCFGSFIPETSRIGYYMNISMVFLIPGIITKISNKKQKIFFAFSIMTAFIVFFAVFLNSLYDINIRILPYRSWIFDTMEILETK